MKLTEEQLREFYRQRTARAARGQADCLSEELLLGAVTKELTRQERERVISHLRVCSDCAREYRVIHSSRQWASGIAPNFVGESGETRTAETQSGRTSALRVLWDKIMPAPKLRPVALVAVVVIALGASLIVWRATHPGRGPEQTERGGAGLVMKIDPPDRAQLGEAPRQLRWTEVKSAERYQVELYDFELTPIWESQPATGTSVEIPDSIRAGLKKGRPAYWRVIVISGIQRRQSDVFQFQLTSSEPR